MSLASLLWDEPETRLVNIKTGAAYDVYIGRGRGSIWENEYTHLTTKTLAKYRVRTREEAIECYRQDILKRPDLLSRLHELKGKTLGCWCLPKACHGQVLIELIRYFDEHPILPIRQR